MSHASASAEYNGDLLTPDQIELLHADFVAELGEFAAADAEPEAEADLEPEAEL